MNQRQQRATSRNMGHARLLGRRKQIWREGLPFPLHFRLDHSHKNHEKQEHTRVGKVTRTSDQKTQLLRTWEKKKKAAVGRTTISDPTKDKTRRALPFCCMMRCPKPKWPYSIKHHCRHFRHHRSLPKCTPFFPWMAAGLLCGSRVAYLWSYVAGSITPGREPRTNPFVAGHGRDPTDTLALRLHIERVIHLL
jgi:hypothetical protein